MPSLSWLRGGSRGKLVNPLVDPVVVLPVSDIVEEGVGGVEVRRDLRCIQDNLFPLIDCFLVIDKLLGYLNGLNKVELAGLHYNVIKLADDEGSTEVDNDTDRTVLSNVNGDHDREDH
jgi:hypothetical protein